MKVQNENFQFIVRHELALDGNPVIYHFGQRIYGLFGLNFIGLDFGNAVILTISAGNKQGDRKYESDYSDHYHKNIEKSGTTTLLKAGNYR
jgi:hypothetical protein